MESHEHSMELHGVSEELHGVFEEFHGILWNVSGNTEYCGASAKLALFISLSQKEWEPGPLEIESL